MSRNLTGAHYVLFLFAITGVTLFAQPPQYTISDLGENTPSLSLTVTAINRHGEVVGTATSSNGQSVAFRTGPNSAIDLPADSLGTLGGTSSSAEGDQCVWSGGGSERHHVRRITRVPHASKRFNQRGDR